MKAMCETRRVALRALARFWSRVREWCGDAAYERYLRSNIGKSEVPEPLNAKDFYLEQLNRRYSQPNRCC
jgi:hypothetical protein